MNKETFLPESRAINMVSKKTIDYYDSNASAYTTNTIDVDFEEEYRLYSELKRALNDTSINEVGNKTGFVSSNFFIYFEDGMILVSKNNHTVSEHKMAAF